MPLSQRSTCNHINVENVEHLSMRIRMDIVGTEFYGMSNLGCERTFFCRINCSKTQLLYRFEITQAVEYSIFYMDTLPMASLLWQWEKSLKKLGIKSILDFTQYVWSMCRTYNQIQFHRIIPKYNKYFLILGKDHILCIHLHSGICTGPRNAPYSHSYFLSYVLSAERWRGIRVLLNHTRMSRDSPCGDGVALSWKRSWPLKIVDVFQHHEKYDEVQECPVHSCVVCMFKFGLNFRILDLYEYILSKDVDCCHGI